MKTTLLSVIFLLLFAQASADTLSVVVGKKVTISVTADGTQPFTYQWMKNGVPIPGATSQTYVIAAVTVDDSATYTVKVANVIDSTISDNAVLTVTPTGTAPTNANTTITVTTS